MIRPIVHDPIFLAQPSVPATADDLPVARDLIDTLAANMIGERKRIIVMARGPMVTAMLNPKILSVSGEYETEEGCLSLAGIRKTKRYRTIKLSWQDMRMKEHTGTLEGFQAQIVQHEIDHCDGILI